MNPDLVLSPEEWKRTIRNAQKTIGYLYNHCKVPNGEHWIKESYCARHPRKPYLIHFIINADGTGAIFQMHSIEQIQDFIAGLERLAADKTRSPIQRAIVKAVLNGESGFDLYNKYNANKGHV